MKNKVLRFFFGINLYELVFDLILVVYVRFYLYGAVLQNGRIIDRLNAGSAITLGLAIDFFVPWYLGILYRQYKNSPQFVRKTIMVLFGFVVFFLYVQIPANLYHYEIISSEMHMMALYVGGLFALIMGAMLGARENEPKESGEDATGLGPTLMMFLAPVEIFVIYLGLLVGERFGIFFGVIAWLSMTVGAALGIMLLSFKIDDLAQKPLGQSFLKWGKILILPFILATLMCAWTEMYIWPTLKYSESSGGTADPAFMVFTLIFTGLLPLRVIMALHPPWRLITLLTGSGAFYFFIVSIMKFFGN